MTELRFRQVATTADIGLLVWGNNKKALFENAAAGLFRILASPAGVSPMEERRVSVKGSDLPALLVAWMSEWLYLFDAEVFIAGRFRIDAIAGKRVEGRGWGETYEPGRHSLLTDVKGITYHDLEILHRGGRYRARLLLDV